jgi:hypothetical protein
MNQWVEESKKKITFIKHIAVKKNSHINIAVNWFLCLYAKYIIIDSHLNQNVVHLLCFFIIFYYICY